MGALARAPAIGTTTGGVHGGMLLAENCLPRGGMQGVGMRPGSARRSRCARPPLLQWLSMVRLPPWPPRSAWLRTRPARSLLRMTLPIWRLPFRLHQVQTLSRYRLSGSHIWRKQLHPLARESPHRRSQIR